MLNYVLTFKTSQIITLLLSYGLQILNNIFFFSGIACSIVCMSNWVFVFIVTKFFTSLVSVIHIYNTFWLFTLFSVVGSFFVFFIVPETKGKTIDEIQKLLGAEQRLQSPEIQ